MKNDSVYMDYNASTPVCPRVLEAMTPWFSERFGNPSANHPWGEDASAAIRLAARHVAALVGCKSSQVIFNSGATEGINHALRGFVGHIWRSQGRKARILLNPTEHKAVLETCEDLALDGRADITRLTADPIGGLSLDEIENHLKSGNHDLVAAMAVNNVTGLILPFEKISALCTQYGATHFCDATQAVGKVPFHFQNNGLHMVVFSAHKIYGPKGSGALIKAPHVKILPLITGGGQQNGQRSGTENVPGIVGLGEACRLALAEWDQRRQGWLEQSRQVQNLLETLGLGSELVMVEPRIPNTLILKPGADISQLKSTYALSAGSACSANSPNAHCSTRYIRISTGF